MRLLLLILLSPLVLFSQTQIHTDIDGELALENSGHAVSSSSDGSIVAIGSPSYDGVREGLVRVFENNGDSWVQIGEDIVGEQLEDHFGSSVSLSSDGSIIAIGGPDAESAGCARVYKNIGNVWTQIGDDINREVAGDEFGKFVSLSNDGTKLAITGYWCCGSYHGTPGIGYTRIYENISNNWTQIGDEISTGFNGVSNISLSNDGTVIAIASSGGGFYASSGFYIGGVKVYRSVSGEWTQIGNTYLAEPEWWSNDYIIASLSDNGSMLFIAGSFYLKVFENIEDNWVQQGEAIETEFYRVHNISLSDDGTILALSNSAYSSTDDLEAFTRIYNYGSDAWIQSGVDIYEEEANDTYGLNHKLSGDGTTIIVGAPNNDGNGTDTGHVRVFDLTALLSVEESNILDIKLYPNPATNQFTITLPDSQTLEKVNIYNNLGQFIQTSNTLIIKTAHLASGLYNIEVITTSRKVTKKLIIN